MTTKRRLPMVQTSAEPETPPRPAWQWSLFGAGLIVLAWLALSLLVSPVASFIVRRNVGSWASPAELDALVAAASPEALGRMALENLALHVLVVGVACLVSGTVVGRWGPGRGIRESAGAGALVALVAVALASTTAAASRPELRSLVGWGLLVLVPWASGLAALGAWRGSHDKRQLTGP